MEAWQILMMKNHEETKVEIRDLGDKVDNMSTKLTRLETKSKMWGLTTGGVSGGVIAALMKIFT